MSSNQVTLEVSGMSEVVIPNILREPPGRIHHPYAKFRSYDYGLSGPNGIPRAFVIIEPYQHYALHLEFGNGTPEECIQWIRKGWAQLDSYPCQILFDGIVSSSKAIKLFKNRYSVSIDKSSREVFTEHPYVWEKRWHRGTKAKISQSHLDNLSLLVEFYRKTERPPIM